MHDSDRLRAVMADRDSKAHTDIRNRLAYVHVTGALPTHLRRLSTRLLVTATNLAGAGSEHCIRVLPEFVTGFRLDSHPMVVRTRRYLEEDFQVVLAPHYTARRPYGRVLLQRRQGEGVARLAVKVDGAVHDRWPSSL